MCTQQNPAQILTSPLPPFFPISHPPPQEKKHKKEKKHKRER